MRPLSGVNLAAFESRLIIISWMRMESALMVAMEAREGSSERDAAGRRSGEVTLEELVRGLNSLGVGPRDLISILQAIKAAGALQAEVEVR